MSETPKRKRLTDDEVAALVETVDNENATLVEIDAAVAALATDHLQAREYVKQLAERLRATVGEHDSDCHAMFNATVELGCNCETGRLLAEVDP